MEKEMSKRDVIEKCIQILGVIELPVIQWKALSAIRETIGRLGLVIKMIDVEEKAKNGKANNE